MGTTALFVEVIIIGVQGITWVTLIMFSIFGYSWTIPLETALKDWAALTTITLMSVIYTFGIIIDRFFNAFTHIFNPSKLILSIPWVKGKAKDALDKENMPLIYQLECTLALNQTYLATRLRIARATLFNCLIIFLASIFFWFTRIFRSNCLFQWKILGFIFLFGVSLLILVLVANVVLEATFEDRNKKIKELPRRRADVT